MNIDVILLETAADGEHKREEGVDGVGQGGRAAAHSLPSPLTSASSSAPAPAPLKSLQTVVSPPKRVPVPVAPEPTTSSTSVLTPLSSKSTARLQVSIQADCSDVTWLRQLYEDV